MATVKKSKKKIIVPIIIALVIVIAIVAIVVVGQSKNGEEASLYTIGTDDIYETVSLTGDVSAGTTKEYKAGTVATVKEVFVKVGDTVKKGDVLATFDVSNLDSQVSSLQSSYNEALSSYNNAVKAQSEAKGKADALESKINALKKQIKKLESPTAAKAADSTAAKTTAKAASTAAKPVSTTKKAAASAKPTASSTKTTASETDASSPSFTIPTSTGTNIGGLSDAVEELNKTLAEITDNIETLTTTTQVIADIISNAAGSLDNKAIADMLVDGLVQSGIAEDMAKQIVSAIDIDAIAAAIADTDNVQLASAQVQLASLEAQQAIFKAQADGSVISVQKKTLNATKEALDVLKNQQKEMSEGWVAAFDGTITAVDVTPGVQTTLLSSGITLENLDSMAVKVNLGEYDLHKVKVGMPATIKTAYGTYDGEVTSIAPTATGGSSGSLLDSVGSMAGISGLSSLTESGAGVECIISIPETDENIIAGFDADVTIQTGEYLGVTVVPIESIKLEKTGSYVYLYNEEEGTATKTQIETGAVSDEASAYQVKSGLNIGDKIISAPAAEYEEDTFKVKIVNTK